MISINRFMKKLEMIIEEMEKLNVRKIKSMALYKVRKNYAKINKTFIKNMIDNLKELGLNKTNIKETDLPNDEARYIFKDITEGKMIVNNLNNEIIIGVSI